MVKKTVVIGMSGGVDSSVAAYLLKEQGYHVIGVTMNIWKKDGIEDTQRRGGCCGFGDIEDAKRVAARIGIEHHVLNFQRDFKEAVITNFIEEYQEGRTPNPCIACNRYVKWQALLNRSIPMGADFISTGHYSKIVKNEKNGRYAIQRLSENGKDQSYPLFNLSQEQLEKTIFPIGNYSKPEIRDIASKIDYVTSVKPDSQEICFIPDNDYGKYLEGVLEHLPPKGDFVDIEGNVLGKHKGIMHYTIGQRKNLGIAFGVPMYVKAIKKDENIVVLSSDKDLYSDNLIADDLNFMYLGKEEITDELEVYAKIRYSHEPTKAFITLVEGGEKVQARFETPQRAITPGQAVVFYDKDGHIVCGGTIVQ